MTAEEAVALWNIGIWETNSSLFPFGYALLETRAPVGCILRPSQDAFSRYIRRETATFLRKWATAMEDRPSGRKASLAPPCLAMPDLVEEEQRAATRIRQEAAAG